MFNVFFYKLYIFLEAFWILILCVYLRIYKLSWQFQKKNYLYIIFKDLPVFGIIRNEMSIYNCYFLFFIWINGNFEISSSCGQWISYLIFSSGNHSNFLFCKEISQHIPHFISICPHSWMFGLVTVIHLIHN